MNTFKTDRTRVRRIPERGHYDKETIYPIIDEALYCHVGINHNCSPVVIPTIHARVKDTLYIHGSAASRLLKSIPGENNICVTITLIDGIVLARSAFHHSLNYRSVVVFGKGDLVEDEREKWDALKAVSDHLVPNRWNDVREPNKKEMEATTVISISLEEASAKIRTGPPGDDDEDYALPVWAGILPTELKKGTLIPDPVLPDSIGIPEYLK
ncbi:MAG: pyridoxamine 5'-phosphate oxidase family protein [Candidatus Marinimicrobia bacterium]|nr:pyridoxamine 5'-phosphate oxidase family protein [Candidatus Neomarinimicrobiota bacterium]MBL7031361.1 pyridoxamine 5'-phosphate oxidase family protein [Candidatus Neomarinimicrobiota bacterium]